MDDVAGENQIYEIATSVPGIDAIVFGHTHSEVRDLRINGVLLTQPNGSAATVSAQSTRVASRRFRANVASPFSAAVRSNLTAVNAGGALRRLPPSSVKSSRLPTACVHRLTHPR